MSEFSHTLFSALTSDDVGLKLQAVESLLGYCNEKNPQFCEASYVPKTFDTPSYAKRCRIVSARQTEVRKRFDTAEGLARLLHAVAHIEYSAIDLALDAAYRFVQMPLAFQKEWLEVAHDEIRHFIMLESLLKKLGFRYGDFAVHAGLFEAGKATAHDVLERMAIVPRFYEATGLDVNPQIIKKLQRVSHYPMAQEAVAIFEVIYDEEIDHVRKGDRWFKYVCKVRGLNYEETYLSLLRKHNLAKHRPHVNVKARKAVGFSCKEMRILGVVECR